MKTAMLFTLLVLPFLSPAQIIEKTTVHFEFNKYQLSIAATRVLDSLIAANKINDTGKTFELHGYCDYKGTDAYNDRLSLQRLLAVKDYLLANKLANAVFSIEKPHGKRDPLNDNSTEEEQMLNRRVEIIITKNAEQPVKKTNLLAMSLTRQLEDSATKPGRALVLENMSFAGSSHHLLSSSYGILQELLSALKKNENLVIRIEGHICCQPGDADGFDNETHTYNLSEERAKAIYTFLIENNIKPERLSYKGWGHRKPIYPYPENSEEESILNRRVEIKIIKN